MILTEWAIKWGVPAAAIAELQTQCLGLDGTLPNAPPGTSEAAVQARVRLEASRKGCRLWRNNVGAGYAEDGAFMRWGLANDSANVNRVLKSADLIGIRPRVIQPDDVGKLFGQFLSREVKAEGWRYSGTAREVAQLNWCNLVNTLGGDASFATSEGSL